MPHRFPGFVALFALPFMLGAGSYPIEGQSAVVKTGKTFKVTARGVFTLPDIGLNDPLSQRVAVELRDSSLIPPLAQLYSPTNAWTFVNGDGSGEWIGLGKPAGVKGYRWRGNDTAECRTIVIKPNSLKAVCKGPAVTAATPAFVGEAQIILSVGDPKPDVDRYCLSFGGTEGANEDGLLRRRKAPAPAVCPPCGSSGYPTCGGTCPSGQVCLPNRQNGVVRNCGCSNPVVACGCSPPFIAGLVCPAGQVCDISGSVACGSASCIPEPLL
jgi:hypothetical protein